MTVGLTARQSECLGVIRDVIRETGIPPSLDELCAALDLQSKSGPLRLLEGLEERGYIRRLSRRARAIALVDRSEGHTSICSCGECCTKRYASQLQLVRAMRNPAPSVLRSTTLDGIKITNPPEPRTRSGVSLGGDQAPPAGAAEGFLSSETLP